MKSTRQRGFTLIELVIVIAVIAILAALLAPAILGQVERARMSAEKRSIGELAKAYARFHANTGAWPYLGRTWDPANPSDAASGGVDAAAYTASDTALHRAIGGLPGCNAGNFENACWGGPYIGQGASMADISMRDAWGRVRMFSIIPPVGLGGSVPTAQNGAIVVWSTGPDGIDQTGCTGGGCTMNKAALAQGLSSANPSDDVVVVVGPAL